MILAPKGGSYMYGPWSMTWVDAWSERGAKFRPLFGTYGHWAGRDLYRATPSTTRDLDLHGFIRKSTSLVASHANPGVQMTYSYKDPNRINRTGKKWLRLAALMASVLGRILNRRNSYCDTGLWFFFIRDLIWKKLPLLVAFYDRQNKKTPTRIPKG